MMFEGPSVPDRTSANKMRVQLVAEYMAAVEQALAVSRDYGWSSPEFATAERTVRELSDLLFQLESAR